MEQTYFSKKQELRSYKIKEKSFQIKISPDVFPPSKWAEKIMESLQVEKDAKIIDIGTGAGIIGIYASLLGGDVYATDISPEAIRQTKENAILNKVSVQCRAGEYFCDFQVKFDLIIANLPQEIIPIEYPVSASLLSTIKGGTKGNELVLGLLKESQNYINQDTKLLLPICSLSYYLETFRYMEERFSIRLRKVLEVKAKEYVLNYEDFYKGLSEAGHIKIFKKNNKWHHLLYIVELQRK